MTRRNLLFGLFAGIPITATAQSVFADVPGTWDKFAMEANSWAKMRLDTPLGAYSWGAKRQWDERVKPAWRDVDRAVKNE